MSSVLPRISTVDIQLVVGFRIVLGPLFSSCHLVFHFTELMIRVLDQAIIWLFLRNDYKMHARVHANAQHTHSKLLTGQD